MLIKILLLLIILIPTVNAIIQTNPPQPVIERDNTYLWLYINSSNATRINLSHNGVQKKVGTIENNFTNKIYTFNYDTDTWGDWQVDLTTNHACIYDYGTLDSCAEFTASLCDDQYECSWTRATYLMNSPSTVETLHNITWNFYGTCVSFAHNITYYLNGVLINKTPIANHCSCTPPIEEYPNVTISKDTELINSTWIHNGVNNLTTIIEGSNYPCVAGVHAVLGFEYSSGDETTELSTIKVGKFNMTEKSDSCNESAINYPCIKEYDIHYDYVNPQEYRHISTSDDIGSLRAQFSVINMTLLDDKERLFIPEYGARFFIIDIDDFFRGIRYDYSDIDYGLWHAGMTPHWYEWNSSHWLLGSSDYYGVTRVGLWNGSTDTQMFASADEGTTHGEGVWCDVLPEGGDNKPEWVVGEESGTVIVYNMSSDNTTFQEAYQSADWGSSSWGFDIHCVDINDDGRDDIFTGDSSGRLRWMNATGTTFSEHLPTTDYGSFYSRFWTGNFDDDSINEIIHGDTDGYITIMYWDEATDNFAQQYMSGDLGYMYHDSSLYVYDIDRDGDLDLITNDYYNDLYVCLNIASGTAFTCSNHYNYDYLSYNNEVCAKDRNGFCHFVKSSGYTPTTIVWDYYHPLTSTPIGTFKLIDREDNYFYKISRAFSSESTGYTVNPFPYDFDDDGDEEVLLISTMGYMLYYDYINYSNIDLKLNYSKELGIVHDYMSRTPETHLVGNKVYCYNDINVASGETNVLLETGSAPSNKQRMTDGILSTDIDKPFEQGSSDYIGLTSGQHKWIQLNFSKSRNIGKIKYIGYFHDNRNVQNLSVSISSDYTTWTTVFNATDEPWLQQGNHRIGTDIYFRPQNVTYIRVETSGYQDNWDGGAWHNGNHITELEAYEGNNCSFMFVPLTNRGATSSDVGDQYDVNIVPEKEEDYRLTYDLADEVSSILSSMARYIIEWVT